MEKFELKVDINTPYIKAIRFIGTFLLGLVVGVLLFKYKTGSEIDWINTFTAIMCSLVFAFFPGAAKKQSLTIDEEGIYTHHYTFHWGDKKEIKWESIAAVGVERNSIRLKKQIGSSERIKLPLHTKDQLSNLKDYLQKIAALKQIEYRN